MWGGHSRGPGGASGGQREGPAAGAGGAFRSAAWGGLVLNFRSAGHVLYTASRPARLHTCVAAENGGHFNWPSLLCIFSIVRVDKRWTGERSFQLGLAMHLLSPTGWMSLHPASRGLTCPCRNLQMLWQPSCRVLQGSAWPSLWCSLGLLPTHLGLWLSLPFSFLLGFSLSFTGCLPVSLSLSTWLSLAGWPSHLPGCLSLCLCLPV